MVVRHFSLVAPVFYAVHLRDQVQQLLATSMKQREEEGKGHEWEEGHQDEDEEEVGQRENWQTWKRCTLAGGRWGRRWRACTSVAVPWPLELPPAAETAPPAVSAVGCRHLAGWREGKRLVAGRGRHKSHRWQPPPSALRSASDSGTAT